MSKRYIIVGGVAGGGSTAARIRRLDENADLQIYDKGPNVAFSNCCLPNYLSREVANAEDLILFQVEEFDKMFNLPVKVLHEVTKIHAKEHKIEVKNLQTGEVFEDHYDVLVLSPGAAAIRPKSISGIDKEHVFVLKNVADVKALDHHLVTKNVEDVVVVGGGFIGVEAAECMKHAGKNVTLVEAADQIMAPFDNEMAQMLHKEVYDNGINLILEDSVTAIEDGEVVLASGKKIKAQAVLLAMGVQPDVKFAVEAGVELGVSGGIKVNQHFETNLKDIYAVGDCIETFQSQTYEKVRLPLAGPAQRQARMLADHLFGRMVENKGVIGSSCIRIFGLNAAATGLNEKACQKAGIDYRVALVMPMDKVGLMPNANPIFFKLVYAYPSGKILGAQAIGKGEVDKRVNVIATMITMGGDLNDLKELELCYAPPFGTAKDAVNFAALTALNSLNGEYEQVSYTKLRDLIAEGAYIVDVRGKAAFDAGHVKGAHNIPLGEIRERHAEIPKDRPVYIHCRTSWFSYYAIRALKGFGYDNIINIQGSFLAISWSEYFKDVTTGRESIVTAYNFN